MADRQTKRERKEEARKHRLEAQRRAARRRRLQRLWSLAIVVIIIAVIAFLVNLSGKSAREKTEAVNALTAAASCDKVETPTTEGAQHINPPQRAEYKTQPPVSGPHYNSGGVGPIATGVSVNEVQPEGYVHNLEHGHFALLYKKDVSEPVREALDGLASADNRFTISAPYEAMPKTVAILAWDKRVMCDGTGTPEAITKLVNEFKKQFSGDAPEGKIPGTPRT